MFETQSQQIIPVDEITFGATIRLTNFENVQYLSVRDFVMHMCDKDSKTASKIWERISKERTDEFSQSCRTFKFAGQGQQEQSVITFPGAIKLAMLLPGENAKKNRSLMASILVRYFAGDPTLIHEIEGNAASNDPVAQMARNTVMDNIDGTNTKRKREDEEMLLENTLAMKQEMYRIEEGTVAMEERKHTNAKRHMLEMLEIEDKKRMSERNHTIEMQRAERDHVIEMAKAQAQAADILKNGIPVVLSVTSPLIPDPTTPIPSTSIPSLIPSTPNHQPRLQKKSNVVKRKGFSFEHSNEAVRGRVLLRAKKAGIKTYMWKKLIHFYETDREAVMALIEEEKTRTEVSLVEIMQQLRLDSIQQNLYLKHLRPILDNHGIQLLSDDRLSLCFYESQKDALEQLMLSAHDLAMKEQLETTVDSLMMEKNFNMANITAFALDIGKKFPTIVNLSASNREKAKNTVMQEFFLHNKYFHELCTNRNAKETIFELLHHAHFGYLQFGNDKRDGVYENVMKHIRENHPQIQLVNKHNNLYFKIKETKLVQKALDECLAIGLVQRP